MPDGTTGSTSPPDRAIVLDLVIGDEGWIVEKIAREIAAALPPGRFEASIARLPSGKADITYFVPYTGQRDVPGSAVGAWFTHQERDEPAKSAFVEAGRAADFCLTPARRYEALLREAGAQDVQTVPHGVDLDVFKPTLKIGVVGRAYASGRKGEALLAPLAAIDGVEVALTGTGWPLPHTPLAPQDLAAFYASLDYLLIPSLVEGGPLPLFEALASGVPVISGDVGCVPDHPHIPFEAGDADDLARVVKGLLAKKAELRASVEDLTWRRFGEAHAKVFERVFERFGPNPHRQAASPHVTLASHGTEAANRGGPTTRMRRLAEGLRSDGWSVGQPDAVPGGAERRATNAVRPRADIVHVFNSWPLRTSVRALEDAKRRGARTVFSPIALNLKDRPLFQDELPRRLAAARGPEDVDAVAAAARSLSEPWDPSGGTAPPEGHADHFASLRRAVSLSDQVICLSDYERAFLDAIGARSVRSALVRNGIDADVMASGEPGAFAERYGVTDYVLCVGRIETRKNQALLAHALRGLDVPLVLIGHVGDGGYHHLVRQLAGGAFVHIDRLEDRALLASAYAGARCVALPSWAEGAPLVALEAAAAGAPMVLSSLSGEAEYLGDDAAYVHPADVAGIEAAVRAIVDSPLSVAERRERRERGRERFSMARHVRETAAVYRALAAEAGPDGPGATSAKAEGERVALDLTHLAHHLASGRPPSGVTAVEAAAASAMMAAGIRTAFVWNSPNDSYAEVAAQDVLAERAADAATGAGLQPGMRRDLAVTSARPRAEAPPLEAMSAKRFAMSAVKQSINALPATPRRAIIGTVRTKRPLFNTEVAPEHRAFGRRAAPTGGGTHPAGLPAPAAPPPLRQERAAGLHLRFSETVSSPTGIDADILYLLGQPWISNDRQLDALLRFVRANDVKLRPLVHDIIYVTDRGAFPGAVADQYRARLARLLRAADHVVVTSRAVEADLAQLAQASGIALRTMRVPLGDRLTPSKTARRKPAGAPSGPFVLYVSSVNARKSHGFLLDIWRDLREQHGDALPTLVLAGAVQPGFERLRGDEDGELARAGARLIEGASDEEVAWLYDRCRFTVYPSRTEGWGFPPLESVLFGKPCVVSDTVPSVAERELPGALRLPAGDWFAWRDAVSSLCLNDAVLDAFARECHGAAEAGWAPMADRLLGRS